MKISLCICTCERPLLLERLLASLKEIELGALRADDIEVVVVDNRPDGRAEALCRRLAACLPLSLRYAAEPTRGISFARNRAVEEALGAGADFIAFIDDDDIPEPDWLVRLVERQRATGADIVAGLSRVDQRSDVPEWAKDTPLVGPRRKNRLNSYGIPAGMSTCNVLIGREILERVSSKGPVFAPEFAFCGSEDIDFFIRAARQGASFDRAETSVVRRSHDRNRFTMRGVLRRGFRLGNAHMHIAQKHATAAQVRRRRNKAVRDLLLGAAVLPVLVFSRARFMRKLYVIGNKFGVLCRYLGIGSDYYRESS
jgi:glycosyltransferase involved in cell wall biosynthesis